MSRGKHGSADDKVQRRIEEWKRKLVDLSRRNRLLFFRPSRATTLQITEPLSGELFDAFVLHEREWQFWAPVPKEWDQGGNRADPSSVGLFRTEEGESDGEQDGRPPRPRRDFFEIAVRPVRGHDELATHVGDPVELVRVLKNLHRRSRTDFEERGVRILYVTFGMLEWRDIERSEAARSPLLLVPAELVRESAQEPFTLRPVEEEAVLNPALDVNLRNDFRIELPAVPGDWDAASLQSYLDSIRELVKGQKWSVALESWIGLFSFHKLVIYRDLSTNGDSIRGHRLVRALAGEPLAEDAGAADGPPTPEDLDRRLDPKSSFLVVDADSSQLACIECVKRGTSLVLHGPPGTGKSQTITNVIAESVAAGRTVLFVSEKMAALEVVYKRLREAHLGDFCLELHSHRANKREVVRELHRCLEERLEPGRALSAQEMETLVRRRQQLCDYVHALHVLRHPLESAVFDVLAELAELHDVPLLSFPCKSIASLSPAVLTHIAEAAQRLQTVWHVALEGESFPWRGCIERSYTAAVRADYVQLLSSCHASLSQLEAAASGAADSVGVAPIVSLGDCTWLVETLRLLAASPGPDPSWLTIGDLEPLVREAEQGAQAIQKLRRVCDELLAQIKGLRGQIVRKHSERFLEVRPDLAEAIGEALRALKAALRGDETDEASLLARRAELAAWTKRLATRVREWRGDSETILEASGLPTEELTVTRSRQLVRLVDLCDAEEKPDKRWLEAGACREVLEALPHLRTAYRLFRQKRDALFATYTEAILELDLDWFVQAFAGRYGRWYRFLFPGFYKARKAIASCSHDGRLSRNAHRDLVLAKEVKRRKAELDAQTPKTKRLLGSYYRGYDTDFDQIERALKVATEAMTLAGQTPLPDALRDQLALDGAVSPAARTAAARLRPSLFETLEVSRSIADLLPLASLPPSGLALEETSLALVGTWASAAATAAAQFRDTTDEAATASATGLPETVEELLQDLEVVGTIRSLEVRLSEAVESLRIRTEELRTRYVGRFTSWEEVLAGLAWADLVRQHFGSRPFTDQFVRVATELPADLPDSSRLADQVQGARAELDTLEAKFDGPLLLDGAPLCEWPLARIMERIAEMNQRVDQLWDWVEFQTVKDALSKLGLGGLFARLEESPPQADVLIQSIHRSVLQKWLGHIFEQDAALSSFRGQNHEKLIAEFRDLDRRHWEVGAHRVIAEANKHRPRVEYVPRDSEVRVLRTEALKQRRHLPIRRLFERMPDLITRLKPCLLMSPLSASQFLSPDMRFDVVVFDEASQICTEDAVCAVYRGSQLLVCGDNKQLPPTAFFQTGMSDEFEGDEPEEDEGFEPLDSVLDDCLALGMCQGWLRWHYRSRHESLIAFSNSRFYDCRLVTFPSCFQEHEDLGIRFIHVADGVYDRGGRRDNPREAEVVADVVFDHFLRHQASKSLGIVAFSQAQMETIEDELERRLQLQPEMQRYFSTDRMEGFFVKNLENVQGDERDVMVFSIGYGRDRTGRMTMNFGPLNQAGGERRLNVAVTRAREKVILVSSIRAADIDLASTQAPGVLALHRYLDYAERGIEALELAQPAQAGDFESPLERDVAQAIRQMGYDVVPQVGCSGFRVDLGVRDPAQPGRFLLGVECDGASYHSGYVARDKDRLRQEVLQRLGWRIHRVWSPDWVSRRDTEVNRLRAAIEDARKVVAAAPDTSSNPGNPHSQGSSPPPRTTKTVAINDEDDDPRGVSWTTPYRVSLLHIMGRPQGSGFHLPERRPEQARLVEKVVTTEGPVHVDLVARRLAQAWGLQRVGSRVDAAATEAIRRAARGGKMKQTGYFLWPADPQFRLRVRVPSPGDPETQRKVEHIAPEEIGLAMRHIVKAGIGISRDALLIETARVFGFERTGYQIRDHLDGVVRKLLTRGELEQRGDVLRIPNGRS
jgi:very-short-patch-repair endonuclease